MEVRVELADVNPVVARVVKVDAKAVHRPVVARVRKAENVLAVRSRPISMCITMRQAGESSLLPACCVERSAVGKFSVFSCQSLVIRGDEPSARTHEIPINH